MAEKTAQPLLLLQFDGKQYKAKSTILSHFQAILDSLK